MTHRSWPDAGTGHLRPARRDVAKALLLVFALIEQEIDVVEQELAALAHRHHSRRTSGDNIRRLREDPGIAEDTAADEHTTDTGLHPFDDLLGLDAIAAAEEPESASRWQPARPGPSRPSRYTTARPSGHVW